jgi:MFS family permease
LIVTPQVVFTLIVPIAGAVSDRGLPRVTTNIVICCICGAIYVPSFLGFQTRSIVACWLLQGVHLALTAWAMGVLPAIVSRIYPAGVRVSGFNLGHNFGESQVLLKVQQE